MDPITKPAAVTPAAFPQRGRPWAARTERTIQERAKMTGNTMLGLPPLAMTAFIRMTEATIPRQERTTAALARAVVRPALNA